MEGTESNCGVKLTDKECYHKKLMVAILRNLADTPLVLKGGTALFLGYTYIVISTVKLITIVKKRNFI